MRIVFVFVFCTYASCNPRNYEKDRSELINDEFQMTFGGDYRITERENIVNNCLMEHKRKELEYAFKHPEDFDLSRHFFDYKDKIRKSKVYKIIKDLPKGAALHVHDRAVLGADYFLNITYMEHLYVCMEDRLKFRFSDTVPTIPCSVPWEVMNETRFLSKNVTKFDGELRKYFTVVVDRDDEYQNYTTVWTRFEKYFSTIFPLLSYKPVWEQFLYDVLKKFREDNIIYVELRTSLPELYNLNGQANDSLATAKVYRSIIRRFVKDYPDFVGAKIILSASKNSSITKIVENIELAKKVKKTYPNYFAGFDLLGREDKGMQLKEIMPLLMNASGYIDYFMHAGETNCYGCPIDENVVDAILLGAKRIGHAYSLAKHPLLMEEVIRMDIALEVNVISNLVLPLLRDIRNHPLSIFFSRDLPVVLSSDDPGVWDAEPMSDDYYVAFMGAASEHSDLRMLKKLAFNSLKYSALKREMKTKAKERLNRQWSKFAYNFNCSKY